MAVSATVTSGKIFQDGETVTISELNKLGSPTVDIAGAVGSLSLEDGSVTNAKVAAATGIQLNKLETGTDTQVAIAGSGGALAFQTMTGDVTISNTGVTELATNSVVTTNITDANVTEDKLIAAVVNKLLPSGTICQFGGDTAPTGWLLCDGTTGKDSVADTTLADLFGIIGTRYGGSGADDFDLPDFRGRVPVGVDGSAARLSADDTLAASGGVEEVTLTPNQIPAHDHPNTPFETECTITSVGTAKPWVLIDPSPPAMEDDSKWRYNNGNYGSGHPSSGRDMYAGDDSSWDDYQTIKHTPSITVGNNTTTGAATNLLQPYLCVEYIIKL